MDGLVKWYSPAKGYGWIIPLVGQPGSVPDLFFHISAVRGGVELPAGARVSFLVVRGNKGPQAASVRVIEARLPGQWHPSGKEEPEKEGQDDVGLS